MDRLDRKLLNALQKDAGRTNAALAQLVGLSASSCLRRVRRLTETGVIRGIVALIDPRLGGRGLRAIVMVELKLHGEQQMRRFLDLAVREPAVTQAFAVTGGPDVVLHLRLRDMEEYDGLCERLFRDNTNVARFYTHTVIRTAKDETAIPL